jgi:hypothetical protein
MNKTATQDFLNLPIDSAELLSYAEDNSNQEPGDHIIDSLLRFSRSYEVRNSELTGKVEFIFN